MPMDRSKLFMDELLEFIKHGNSISVSELASKFEMTTDMLAARLERYEQLGYVKKVILDTSPCSQGCKTCKGCTSIKNKKNEPITFWEKGEKLK